MSHHAGETESPRRRVARSLSGDALLWVVTGLALLLDVLTTLYGLYRGLAELNPVVLAFIPTFGTVGALLFLKAVVLGVGLLAWWLLPAKYRAAVPIGVAVPWGIAGLMNTQLILVTVFG